MCIPSTTLKDIIPEPVKPGGVHPELGCQVDSQRESTVHGVVEKSPARETKGKVEGHNQKQFPKMVFKKSSYFEVCFCALLLPVNNYAQCFSALFCVLVKM